MLDNGALEIGAWVFGYGSLIWRPDFEAIETRPARVTGWRREFWQASPDHRGTPQAPGRVVTLIEDAAAFCVGRAYRVEQAAMQDIVTELEIRECAGYEQRIQALFDPHSGEAFARGLLYVAGPSNPNFLGTASQADMLQQIRRASGQSGSNVQYVLRLADALRELGVQDDAVFALAKALN